MRLPTDICPSIRGTSVASLDWVTVSWNSHYAIVYGIVYAIVYG